MKKIEVILKENLSVVKPSEKEMKQLNEEAERVIREIRGKIKSKKIKADVFLGGSLAKGTVIKKKKYDIDIFVRFDKKYKDEELSDMLSKLVKARRIHGSRDYFQAVKGNVMFEIIPVVKVNKPEESRNITDLSYFHVAYLLKKMKKNSKLGDEIILAKAFCYAQKCYGAESYIRGFSGYALELLVSHYGSFLNFIKEASKKEKIVIDDEKFYKNEEEIENEMNEAKLSSPIVLVDPTFKERNALAALSRETYCKFRESCASFLKNPSSKFFEILEVNEGNFNLIVEASSSRQEGDIAGSKLLKFFNFFSNEIGKNFVIKKKYFEYDTTGRFYFFVEKRGEVILHGPPVSRAENLLAFKNEHSDVFIKKDIAYAREKPRTLKEIMEKAKKEMKAMGISELRVIKE